MYTAVANLTAMLNADKAQIDGGTPPATWEVRTGTRPAIGSADTGTILAQGTLANPSGTVATTAYTITVNSDTSADNSGTPGYVVFKQGGTGAVQHRFTAGVGSGEVSFSSTITGNGVVSFTSFVINAPADA
jgi:hypothetical protein